MLERSGVDLRAIFFISGPPSMIPDMRRLLAGMGVPEDRIRYEQWW
jgi:ferredoxin-NADP reductase